MLILLIDDEPIELFVSKRFLSMAHTVEAFGSLPEALAWAKANAFDILVSDYYLGGSTHAPDVLRELRAINGTSFRAFVLTNHLDPAKEAELAAAGFDGTIEKPLSPEKFKSVTGL